ncbi:MAG: sulfatase-like hydrolase/transferase, partial [Planctomycetota bacterium]
MLSRRKFLQHAGFAAASAALGHGVSAFADSAKQTKPNFLIIMADDCTYNDLPVYGGQNAATPNIDRLASEGLVFNRAYLGSAMCQPCRAELYSGLYPMRNGCA